MTNSNHESNAQRLGHLSWDRAKVDRRHRRGHAAGRKSRETK